MKKEDKQNWIFTFGYDHKCQDGTPLRDRYAVIYGTFMDARKIMFALRGPVWSMQYKSEEDAGVKTWNLKKIKQKDIILKS